LLSFLVSDLLLISSMYISLPHMPHHPAFLNQLSSPSAFTTIQIIFCFLFSLFALSFFLVCAHVDGRASL
jgi:hypothetical protein